MFGTYDDGRDMSVNSLGRSEIGNISLLRAIFFCNPRFNSEVPLL